MGQKSKVIKKGISVISKVGVILWDSGVGEKILPTVIENTNKSLSKFKEEKRVLPNLVNYDLEQAKNIVEKQNFKVLCLPCNDGVKLDSKLVKKMIPKPGNYREGTEIQLYYYDENFIDSKKSLVELENVCGLGIERATEILKERGFLVEKILLNPNKKYANYRVNTVIDMDPKPNPINKHLKVGKLVKVKYIDEDVLEESNLIKNNESSKNTVFKNISKLGESVTKR